MNGNLSIYEIIGEHFRRKVRASAWIERPHDACRWAKVRPISPLIAA